MALIASQSELAPEAIGDWIALDSGYPTPSWMCEPSSRTMRAISCWCRSVATGSGPCRGLVRHWRLAGGAVVREVVEETGLACRAVQLLALFDKLKHPHPRNCPMPTRLSSCAR